MENQLRVNVWAVGTPTTEHVGPLRNKNTLGWSAKTDAEALSAWLEERGNASPHTAAAYRREVERFLLWLSSKGMTVSDALREYYVEYANFLLNPTPKDEWVASRKYKRTDPRWRPFTDPLTPEAARYSLQILASAISHLHKHGWLQINPMPAPKYLMPITSVSREQMVESRQLPEHIFEDLKKFIDLKAKSEQHQRDRYKNARNALIVSLAGVIASRTADMTAGFLSDFSPQNFSGEIRWVWHIPEGKGRKSAVLPIPSEVMNRVRQVRLTLGLSKDPQYGEQPCPILTNASSIPFEGYPDVRKLKCLSRSALYRIVKTLFSDFAEWLKTEGRTTDAIVVKRASTHWLRHTAIKKITKDSGDLLLAQQLGRHSNINTTAIYGKSTLKDLSDWFRSQE